MLLPPLKLTLAVEADVICLFPPTNETEFSKGTPSAEFLFNEL